MTRELAELIRCLDEEEKILAQYAAQQRPALYAAVAYLLRARRALEPKP